MALIVLALVLPLRSVRAQDPAGAVALPPFLVEEDKKGPPWRYGQIPGFEILSRCSDRTTRDLAETHYRLHQLLTLLLPERLQVSFAVPRAMIFYDESLQSASSKEVLASMLGHAAKDSVPVDTPWSGAGRRGSYGPPVARISFLPNLRLWDRDAMMVFSIVREGGYDSDRLALTPDYINYLVTSRTPPLPWWFMSGIFTLYGLTEYETGALYVRPITWVSESATDALKSDPKAPVELVPLQEFFTTAPPRPTPENEARRQIWLSQCALFIRWALDGRTPEQRDAFGDLVARAATGITPEAFQHCFGVDFTAADKLLADYLRTAVRKAITLKPAQPIKPPKIELRNATDAEIARIKGDWERLEVGYVRSRMPDYADKYLDQARRTLRRAYDLGLRDPQMLAVAGLCECDAGNDGTAREYLELASRLGPLRPRANYELARLRFNEAIASPAGESGRLSPAQLGRIFTPLFAARAQAPAQAEVYELIAQVWASSAYVPTREHLMVLGEGVRMFPRRASLVYRVAALYAERGFSKEAAELVRLGLIVAPEGADRDRFAQLQTQLAAAAPAEK